ncbi:MAG: FAD-linked oxidase C-terminal domain-containing protein [Desulfobacteraceae bacterium]
MTMEADLINALSRLAGNIDGEVYTDDLRRYMLATDASIFQVMPLAVVYPRTTADVAETVRLADRRRISLHPRGAGSGLCGSAVGEGIVLDFSKFMHRLLRLNLEEGWFECQPGYRLGELESALAGGLLFFPPDPSSGEYATFGGMTNTNASGAHSVKYGNVADYFMDAEVVLADGAVYTLSQVASMPVAELPENLQHLVDLYRSNADAIEAAYPPIACNVAGYNLRGLVDDSRLRLHRLLAGAEGTLAIITRLKFRLIPKPAADALVVAYFDDIVQAAKAVQLTMPLGPSGIEIMDKSLLDLARATDATLRERIPEGVDNVLLIEFDGPSAQDCARLVDESRLLLSRNLARSIHPAASAGEKEKFWALRKAAVPILYKLKGEKKILALVEDAAIPVDRLVDYFDGIYRIFGRHDVQFVLYGHIAKGLMHTRPLLNLKDARDCAMLKPIADAVYELVDRLGGTVSGEHGDGRLRSAYLRRTYGDVYPLFERVKALLDPRGLLNPGIKQADDPEQMSRHLRLGPAYRSEPPKQLQLIWQSSFVAEAEKCHGCSKCTTITTTTRMCPVYKVTRDETAAPKAKANVLRGLISGVLEQDAMYQSGLQQVMAQCINCGSCFKECPSNVNIPKLAMEAKAIYVRRFGSPVSEKLTANVEVAAKTFHPFMALLAPALRSPLVNGLAARLGGLAPQREMVAFARRPLYRRVSRRIQGSGPSVLYYAGCYAGYIRPELGEAAIEVLTRAGFEVHLPPQSCCGLPHLSKGMVTAARRKVMENLRSWQKSLDGIDHIVVSCSSCGFALMKDWGCLISDQGMAERISAKTVHICHLLNRSMDRLELRKIPMKVAYHQPCHLRIQPDSDSSLTLLSAVPGVEPCDLKSHCCGMAGSWGLLAKNYATSRSIGIPMIDKLNGSGAQCGVTDCPTCQLQMEHLGDLPVRHPVEIVRAALQDR